MTTAADLQAARDDPAHRHSWGGWVETQSFVERQWVPSGRETRRCLTCGRMGHRETRRPETEYEGGYT